MTEKQPKNMIKDERIAAYDKLLMIFPTSADIARELALDNRATVGHWKTRGVPIEYILIMDYLELIDKKKLIPSVKNWDLLLSKHAQVIDNRLKSILKLRAIRGTAQTALQTSFGPAIREEVVRTLIDLNVIEAPEEESVEAIL
jgi:hypothetical protein